MPRFTKGSIEAKEHMAHLRSMRGSGLGSSKVQNDDSHLFSSSIQIMPTVVAQPLTAKKNLIKTKKTIKKIYIAPNQSSTPKLDERQENPTIFKDKNSRKVGVNDNQIKTKYGYIHKDLHGANAEFKNKLKEESKTKETLHPDIKRVKYAWGEFVNDKK